VDLAYLITIVEILIYSNSANHIFFFPKINCVGKIC
jgi:hypothetical protein